MKMIVAVSENWGIGLKGRLLFDIPEDMKYFKEKTLGSTVVMGRTTLETLPQSKPLKGRTNIVLSSDRELKIDGASVVHDLNELFSAIKNIEDEIFVIGGADVFEKLEPYCEYALVTKVYASHEADRFFPNLDKLANWKVISQSDESSTKGLSYRFFVYQNINVISIPE